MNKQFLLKKVIATITALCLLSYSVIGYSQDLDTRTNITAGIMNHFFDNDKMQNDETDIQVGFETSLFDTERWTVALQYYEFDSNIIDSMAEATVLQYHAGANYNFDKIFGFQPYLGAGIGKSRISRSVLDNISGPSLDINVGVKYFFSNNWMAKFEAIAIDTKQFNRDIAIGISVGYVFGTPARSSAVIPSPALVAPADSDGDGVDDNTDNCSNTKMGLAVDNIGCVILDKVQRRENLAVLFDTDMSEIKGEYQNEIEDFAEFMREYNSIPATIEGHTDSDGTADYNQALSEQRANAIRTELIMRYGISASRLTAEGFGESRPTSTNSTAAGKAMNRRIEAAVSVMVETERMR